MLSAKGESGDKAKGEDSVKASSVPPQTKQLGLPGWDPNFWKQFSGKPLTPSVEDTPPKIPETPPPSDKIQDFFSNLLKSVWDLFKLSDPTHHKTENKESTKDDPKSTPNKTHKDEEGE
ncbi:uncharacterized protein LOC112906101 isoform X1 [Agrilus planipennis]|nr:uncharacterized protein LOC112906101 isoform X1 [Agrilus planipennis]